MATVPLSLTDHRRSEMIRLAAELELLTTYNRRRQVAGHDYGCGQRGRELFRRRRELCTMLVDHGLLYDELLPLVDAAAMREAWQTIGAPRLRRAASEQYRRETPSTRRTLRTWRGLAVW